MNDSDNRLRYKFWKRYHLFVASIPLFAVAATALMWVDTRYMHQDIADIRHLETQIRLVEGHIRDYNRIINSGGQPNADEVTQYEMDKEELKNLLNERNKILGIVQ